MPGPNLVLVVISSIRNPCLNLSYYYMYNYRSRWTLSRQIWKFSNYLPIGRSFNQQKKLHYQTNSRLKQMDISVIRYKNIYNNMIHEAFWEERSMKAYIIKADPLLIKQSQRFIYYMIVQFHHVKCSTFKKTYLSGIKQWFSNKNIPWRTDYLQDVYDVFKWVERFEGGRIIEACAPPGR